MKNETVKIDNCVKPLRLGFLGVGWIGKNRLEALLKKGIAEVTVVADSVAENARNAAKENTIVCNSFDDLLVHDIDGVVIATPSALHADQAITALNYGLPVFCQKPLGRNLNEVEKVVDAAFSNNKLLGIDLSYRFLETVSVVKKLIKSGEIGNVFAIDAVFHNAYGPDKPWFYDPKLAGGGCVIDLGIHLIDLIMWIFDFPQVHNVYSRLYADGQKIKNRSDKVEDYAVANFELENGCNINLTCSWKLQAGCDAVISITFYGSHGALSVKNTNGSFYNFTAERFRGTKKELLYDANDDWGGKAIIDWAQRLCCNNLFDNSVIKIKNVANIIDMIYKNC